MIILYVSLIYQVDEDLSTAGGLGSSLLRCSLRLRGFFGRLLRGRGSERSEHNLSPALRNLIICKINNCHDVFMLLYLILVSVNELLNSPYYQYNN
jgi:hypothetical protein